MNRKWTDLIYRHYVMAYTMVFVIAAAVVFYFIPVYRYSLINSADGFNQYYPAYVYIGRYLREMIPTLLQEHTIPMFDFSLGYGDDIMTTLNYYGFGNVFYLLSALAPDKFASILYTLETILQIYLAGLAFSYSLGNQQIRVQTRLAGAMIYAFSGYTLSFGVTFPTFLMALVTFPLLVDGMNHVMESRRFHLSLRYILALFLLSCCGFYFLYMEVIAVVIYCVLYGVFHFRNRFLAYVRAILCLFAQSVIAVGMSCVILLPVVIAYFASERAQEERVWNDVLSLYDVSELLERVRGILIDPGKGEALGLTIPILFLIVIFLARHRKRYPVIASELVICVAGFFIPAVGSVMNGLSYSSDRWMYIVYYFISVSVTLTLQDLDETLQSDQRLCRVAVSIAAVVYLAWAAITLWSDALERTQAATQILLIGITMLLLVFILHAAGRGFAWYCIACTILIAFMNNAPASLGGDGYYRDFKNFYVWHEIQASKLAETEQDERFHRTDIYDSSLDSSLVLQENTASSYYSMFNSGPYEFLAARLVSTGTEASTYTLRGLDGRKALEMFFSVTRYATDRSAEEIVENDLALPLGFTYTSYMLDEDAASVDSLDRNQNVLKLVELEEQPEADGLSEISESTSDWDAITCDYRYYNIDETENHVIHVNETSEIDVELPSDIQLDENTEYYLLFHGLEWLEDDFERYLDVNGKLMRIRPNHSYPLQQSEYMVKLDLSDEDVAQGSIAIRFLKDATYHLEGLELRSLDTSEYQRYYDQLTESSLEDVMMQANRISGHISTDQDKILLMTIPYSAGWTCMVDGVRQKVYKADQGYSAVEIPVGDHEVVWSYCTPGIIPGACVTVVSLLILCLLMWRQRMDPTQLEV